jgi:hypothetical protein
MTTSNLDAYNLSQVALDGEIKEDVLDQLIRIDEWDNPFLAMCGGRKVGNPYYSWTTRDYAPAVLTGQLVDGADAGVDQSRTGIRVGNHTQILDKVLRVSEGAQAANTIAAANELALQVQERGVELLRTISAQLCSNNSSVEGTSSVAGQTAGLNAWLNNRNIDDSADTGVIVSVASANDSTDGGWVNRTGNIVPGRTYASTTPGAITEDALKDVSQAIYLQGGNPTKLLARPQMIRTMSEYFFTSGARIATLQSKVDQSTTSGLNAQGRVNVWVSDFAVVTLIPDRNLLIADSASASDTVFVLDPSQLRKVDYKSLSLNNLAKNGTADNRQLVWYGGGAVDAWPKCGAVVDIAAASAMTAS